MHTFLPLVLPPRAVASAKEGAHVLVLPPRAIASIRF
jgi:hypothetical protein